MKINNEYFKEKQFYALNKKDLSIPKYLHRYWDDLSVSWDSLVEDKYMKGNDSYRKRRFGHFHVDVESGDIFPLEGTTFFQSSEINVYAGDIERRFSPLLDETYNNKLLRHLILSSIHAFCETFEVTETEWDVTLHQFRILAKEGSSGLPTPEGIHQDGHDFISMHLICRENIDGGVSSIYNLSKNKVEDITLELPLDTILVNDKKVFHSVSPITQVDTELKGYRDILVIDYNKKGKK